MTCPSCGADNPPGARFCASCGTELHDACPSCGTVLAPGARFCQSCGQPVAAPEAGEERKLVTVLFADVADSTGLGERLDAERLKEVMGTYFRAMRGAIEAQGGTVEKFIGDAVMAVFGVPTAHEDDPARALQAALAMRERLAGLNEELSRRHGVTLEIRVGINTGEVMAVTDPRPGEAMVAGDAVNVAARLQAAGAPGEVIVAERTARSAPGFAFEELGPLELRGKRDPVSALRMVGRAELHARGIPGLHAPLVGRDAEMDLLRSLFERAAVERRPHLVTIYGDAGVGKSRLVREFVAWAEGSEHHPTVVRGRCLPYGEGVTYWPLAEVLKEVAGILNTDPIELAVEKLGKLGRDLLHPDTTTNPELAIAALAHTLGLPEAAQALQGLPPEQLRAELQAAWRSFFSALASQGPVICVMEDIHWADPALLDLLEDLAQRTEGGVLWMCPSRPELTEHRPGWGGGRRSFSAVVLEPLSPGDAGRLVGFLLDVEDLPAAVHERILSRAEGNPFFLEEIIRRLIDEGTIVRRGDRWVAGATVETVDIPDTVQGVLAARIDLLEAAQKRVLQMAAVVGRVFWLGPVARLLGRPPAEVDLQVRALADRELVSERLGSAMAGDREFIFKHILTRDVAYESLPRRDRAGVHAEVARWIEDFAADRRSEFVELLTYHWVEAHRYAREAGSPDAEELRERAFGSLLAAVRDARRKVALPRAVRYAEEALVLASSPLERAQALEVRGLAAWDEAEGDVAWRSLRDAVETRLEHVPDDGRGIARAAALAVQVPTRSPGGMTERPSEEEVGRLIDVGLRHAGEGDSVDRARLLAARAFWPFAYPEGIEGDQELDRFEAAGEEAAAMALRLDRPALASAALDAAQSRYGGIGLYGRGLPLMQRRLELVDRITDASEISDIYAVASWHEFHIGRYRQGVRYAEEGLRRVSGRAPSWEAHLLAWLGVNHCRLGDWEAVEDVLIQTRELLGDRFRRPPGFVRRLHGAAAWMHEVRGRRDIAEEYLDILDEAAAVDHAAPEQQSRYYGAVGWVALLHIQRGNIEEARAVIEGEEAEPFRTHHGSVLEARCELVAAAQAWDEAPEVLRRARQHAAEAQVVALLAFADRLEGRAALAAGDPDEGVRALTLAADRFGELEARWERAVTELDLAEAVRARGDAAGAHRLVARSTPVFEELSSVRELQRARTLERALG